MNQEQKEVIIKSVNEIGLTDTLTIFGGNGDIIRKAYIDNPERYLDYLIGNLLKDYKPVNDEICFLYPIEDNYEVIFECKRPSHEFKLNDVVYVSRFIWNYFYVNIMKFSYEEIQNTIKLWITKNIPDLSSLTPECKKGFNLSYPTMDMEFQDEIMVHPTNHRL
jgi:hypothetical protein